VGAVALAGDRMILEVSHRTSYTYTEPVLQSQHLIHLVPRQGLCRQGVRQTVLRHSLLVDPAPSENAARTDYFGNETSILTIEGEHSELVIHARSTVEVEAAPAPDVGRSGAWERAAATALTADGEYDIAVLQFASASRHTRPLREAIAYARPSFAAGRPILEAAFELTRRIHADFIFDATATDIATPVSHLFRARRGVCQDFAHLALTCLRSLSLPARYVSGYLLTLPPPGMEKRKGADASHAWISVWAGDFGWVDFDPTNGLMPAGEHVTLAYGRDYDDVSPIGGVLLGGGDQRMRVAVDVTPAQ
jgi:transglutaminase-like putative cysteine protease